MKFAEPVWLLGTLFAIVVAVLFVLGGLGGTKATRRFGDPERVRDLLTARPAARRVWKAVFVVAATALAFVALARPQYGRGTRLIPATNLDVVIVLDYSKSMYARDVSPSRIARAKAEVARLIHDLAGARFGAIAFAGEPIAFPLSSDGAAIAQFFRQLDPNDMPVGGTAIARALERARELFASDPKSKDHSRVIVLVTDGEDLEGEPASVARAAAQDGTVIHVVQIGGRTPERIPEVSADGRVSGYRRDEQGDPLTTALSAEGEAQLAEIASTTGGKIIRSEHGAVAVDAVARDLRRKMSEELAERVETIYADVYAYPLGLALLLLVLEGLVSEAKLRRLGATSALPLLLLPALAASGCGWDPKRPFDREVPEVRRALVELEAGNSPHAAELLEGYLSTGACSDGGFGLPDKVRERPNASFDLGIALFHVGEKYGHRFGEEVARASDAGPSPEEQRLTELRSTEIDCALRAVLAIAYETAVPIDLRARGHYLAGNLEFLRAHYDEAVRHYDEALKLVPGVIDGGDRVGADAAFNRAVALTRAEDEEKKKRDRDAGPPSADGGGKPGADGGNAPADGGKGKPPPDGGGNGDKDKDKQKDAGSQPPAPEPDAAPPPADGGPKEAPPPTSNQDDRLLDMLESAPTFQQQDAKNRAGGRRGRGMIDK